MFRDQSDDITAKFQTSKAGKPSRKQTRSPVVANSKRSLTVKPQSNYDLCRSLPVNPFFPAEAQASCFFFSRYILNNADSTLRRGYLNFLPDICAKEPTGSALSNIVTSLGLACLSNQRKDPGTMTVAVSKYTEALRLINAALMDPTQAKSDQTLISVMLLSLFEARWFTPTLDSD